MRIGSFGTWLGFAVLCSVYPLTAGEPVTGKLDQASVDRGRGYVRSLRSPLAMSPTAYSNLWKRWGLKERPEELDEWMSKRYGLAKQKKESPYPLGLVSMAPVGVGHNCLLCHASRIAGKTVVGLGNASLDFQTLLDDLAAVDLFPLKIPFTMSHGRGSIEATAGTLYLMQFRDKDLNLRGTPAKLRVVDHLCEDLPAWWLLKHKKTMFHTGSTDARSVRAGLSFLLAPLNSARMVKSHEPAMADIKAYLRSLEAPKYPFVIDGKLAKRGEPVFRDNCSHCHGTYGSQVKYPNRVIPLDEIGTDPTLVNFFGTPTEAERDYFSKSWLIAETDKDGKSYHNVHQGGYQAPPLTGVWATAPYFHNGSVPTVYHVLNSKARPSLYTRSYRTDEADYDKGKLGWKIEALKGQPDPKLPAVERRKIYDASQKGRGNGGHTFGDDLTDDERRAVIEYLKTL